MARRGKNYLKALEKIDKQKIYNIKEALELIKDVSYAKFDETIEIVFKLGIDPKHADQMVRGSVVLPHGLGKSVKVAVFAQGPKATEAKEAGADYVGDEDLIEKIESGWIDFDKTVATPDMMRLVGKLGKILGPRGLMPSPKVGTVTNDVANIVKSLKAGMLEFRNDKAGLVHVPIGKKSFSIDQLLDNFNALYDVIMKAKPSTSKGQYMLGIYMSSTMSPGVQIDSQRVA